MTYTKVAKPTTQNYTNTNTVGKQQYNQTDIIYDDPTVFYDGINTAQYTKVGKPSAQSYTKIAKPI